MTRNNDPILVAGSVGGASISLAFAGRGFRAPQRAGAAA
jgi:hypothetical protein